MDKALVSVITVVRNDVGNIADTMLSVLKQTYSEFEYIVKDGLSTDGTINRIQKVKSEFADKTVKVISSSDTGIYDAMNQAVSYCGGEWVIFINSGDSFYEESVLSEVFDRGMDYSDIGVLYGDAIVRDESGDAVWKADLEKVESKMPFCHQSCFVRRELLMRFPFDSNYKIAADYNHILDLYQSKKRFYDVKKTVSVFGLDGVSSTDFVKRYKERNAVLIAHGLTRKYSILYLAGLLFNYMKLLVGRYAPPEKLVKLKAWYKRNVKGYELPDDCKKGSSI